MIANLGLLLTMLIWGGFIPILNLVFDRWDPWSLAAIRYWIALPLLAFDTLHTGAAAAIRTAVFQVVSYGSTTGYGTADPSGWPLYTPLLLMVAAFMCGCAGSTAGGVKVVRVLLFMRQALREGDYVVALEVKGSAMTTGQLARWLAERMASGRDLALLVGGPDGLDARLSAEADFRWSLSPLTWPHALVRILVAEQLYRAHSLLQGHPYHRA